MSPATTRKKGEPREIERSDKAKIPVEVANGEIRVQWDCQTRSFTVADLRRFIEHVDLTAKVTHPFSLEWADSHARRFWVRLKDGKLYAASSFLADTPGPSTQSVSWALLKRAFQATIAEMADEADKSPRADT